MIKKVFVIIIAFFVFLTCVKAQEEGKYKLSVTFSPIYNNGNTMSSLDIYYHNTHLSTSKTKNKSTAYIVVVK